MQTQGFTGRVYWRCGSRLVLATLGCLFTCHDAHHFNAQFDGTATLSAYSSPSSLDFGSLDALDLLAHPQLSSQGIGREQLSSVTLSTLALRIDQPKAHQDLGFISNVSVYLSSNGEQGPLIAQGESFEPGLRLASLEVLDVELKPFFASAQKPVLALQVLVTYNTNALASQDTVVVANPTFRVLTTQAQTFCSN
jgi:hypothetical protein